MLQFFSLIKIDQWDKGYFKDPLVYASKFSSG